MAPIHHRRSSALMARGRTGTLLAAIQYLSNAFVNYHSHAPFRIKLIAWVGVVALPLYYFVWHDLFPQPYENMLLRLIGAGLCLMLALADHWPVGWKKYYYVFAFGLLVYTLPFFFSFMLLMNKGNIVWQMSTMAALLFTALLFDTANMLVGVIIGAAAGYGLYMMVGEGTSPTAVYQQTLPIFVFTLVIIRVLLSFNDRYVEQEKMRAAKTLAGHIAHEMRTPLLGVQFDAGKVRQLLPALVSSYDWARQNGWSGPRLPPAQFKGVASSMDRICEHASSANLIIDMLLVNARHDRVRQQGFETIRMNAVVRQAIDRFHFRLGERQRVEIRYGEDFTFRGSELLTIHVVFNLLKNALKAVEPVTGGAITLSTGRRDRLGQFMISDNGAGIPPKLIDEIFTPFATGATAGTGSGMGLAFCKTVIEGFGGHIDCFTEAGHGTTFICAVPLADTPQKGGTGEPGRSS